MGLFFLPCCTGEELFTESQGTQAVAGNDGLTQPSASMIQEQSSRDVSFDTYKTRQGRAIPLATKATVNPTNDGKGETRANGNPPTPATKPKRIRAPRPEKKPRRKKPPPMKARVKKTPKPRTRKRVTEKVDDARKQPNDEPNAVHPRVTPSIIIALPDT